MGQPVVAISERVCVGELSGNLWSLLDDAIYHFCAGYLCPSGEE